MNTNNAQLIKLQDTITEFFNQEIKDITMFYSVSSENIADNYYDENEKLFSMIVDINIELENGEWVQLSGYGYSESDNINDWESLNGYCSHDVTDFNNTITLSEQLEKKYSIVDLNDGELYEILADSLAMLHHGYNDDIRAGVRFVSEWM